MTKDNGASDDRALASEAATRLQPPAVDPSREPRVLIFADDPERTPRLYACPTCGSVHSPAIYMATEERRHEAARQAAADCWDCKKHGNCQYCNAECPKGWTACDECRCQRKLDAAVEIEDDGGPYFAFGGDAMFWELCEARDEGLEWVCPTTETYPRICLESVLENVVAEMHEDASIDDLCRVRQLEKAIDAFNDAQTSKTYWADEKRKIRVPTQGIETGTAKTEGLGPKDESPVAESDAPNSSQGAHP